MRGAPEASGGWVIYTDQASGHRYHHNPATGESVWVEEAPAAPSNAAWAPEPPPPAEPFSRADPPQRFPGARAIGAGGREGGRRSPSAIPARFALACLWPWHSRTGGGPGT